MSGRRGFRWLAVGGFLAGALVFPPPAAAAPPAASGMTTFTAVNGGSTEFRLTRPAALHLRADLTIDEITVDGVAGRLSGIVLAEHGIGRARGGAVFAFSFNGCWTRGCRKPADEKLFPRTMMGSVRTNDVKHDDGSRTILLGPGRYTAYVFGDGAPVAVTVRFSGSSGHGRIVATRRLTAAMTSVESRFAGQPEGATLYSAGATGGISSPVGVIVGMMESRTALHASTTAGVCHYAGGGPPNDTFLPHCPGGSGSTIVLNSVARIHHGVQSVTVVTGPNEWTSGIFMHGAEVREWVSPTALLWLSLN